MANLLAPAIAIAFAPDENRFVLAADQRAESKRRERFIRRSITTGVRLIHSDTPLDIRIETSPSDKAAAFIKEK